MRVDRSSICRARRTGTAERGADEIVVYSNRFGVGPFDHCEGRLRHPAARACAPVRVAFWLNRQFGQAWQRLYTVHTPAGGQAQTGKAL
jgi:hypothetical protein